MLHTPPLAHVRVQAPGAIIPVPVPVFHKKYTKRIFLCSIFNFLRQGPLRTDGTLFGHVHTESV
jgi:hypothetical protein